MATRGLQQGEAADRSWLDVVARGALDVLAVHDPEGIILWASDSYERVLGWKPDQMVGENPYAFVHPDDIPDIEASHANSLGGEHGSLVSCRFRLPDGTYRWVETSTRTVEHDALDLLVTTTRPLANPPEKAVFVPAPGPYPL